MSQVTTKAISLFLGPTGNTLTYLLEFTIFVTLRCDSLLLTNTLLMLLSIIYLVFTQNHCLSLQVTWCYLNALL